MHASLARVVRRASASSTRNKATVVLTRHGESTWNLENKFTGWYDCPLSAKGHEEAAEGGRLLAAAGLTFDVAYTSTLKRAIRTLDHALEESDHMWIPVTKAWQLNERHYGALQGLDKQKTVDKYGIDQVTIWRRSYDVPPPDTERDSPMWPGNDPKYAAIDKNVLPTTESLLTTAARVIPYWQGVIVPELIAGKNVIVSAHGNSLRALVQYLDAISNEDILSLNIPTATPLVYEFDDDCEVVPNPNGIGPLRGGYLGDQDAIRARIEGVANQTKG